MALKAGNLATAVYTRFHQLGGMEDLEEAIICRRKALDLQPLGHPDRPSSLSDLAGVITIRFRHSRSSNDFLDAVKHCSEAKNILPSGDPYQSAIGSRLASILLMQYDIIPELEHESIRGMTNAFDLFEQAVNHSPASVKGRFERAVIWAREAHQRDHLSAVKAYTKSLTLLGRRLVLAPTIESQQIRLATVPKALALDAASCSINRREFRSAIELLEQEDIRRVAHSPNAEVRHMM